MHEFVWRLILAICISRSYNLKPRIQVFCYAQCWELTAVKLQCRTTDFEFCYAFVCLQAFFWEATVATISMSGWGFWILLRGHLCGRYCMGGGVQFRATDLGFCHATYFQEIMIWDVTFSEVTFTSHGYIDFVIKSFVSN